MSVSKRMEPSTSRVAPNRNPRGKVVRSQAKKMIINIYHEKLEAYPNATYKDIRAMVSKTSGIGVGTISAVLSEYRKTGKVSSPTVTRTKPGVFDKLNDQQKSKIRQHVHDFWHRKEVPTVKKMLEVVNMDEDLPTFSSSSFRRVLQHLNFGYAKSGRSSGLIEHLQEANIQIPIFDHTYTPSAPQIQLPISLCMQKQKKNKKKVTK
ncbi:uncharacterized protein LOC100877296 isoform X2 [Megachile rotundata]|uniref:uncharacterized protein LOC100877296 isoform X2 n=1 Tax=Megachile rotundata TaxID=143995 RepID=UPI003FD0A224